MASVSKMYCYDYLPLPNLTFHADIKISTPNRKAIISPINWRFNFSCTSTSQQYIAFQVNSSSFQGLRVTLQKPNVKWVLLASDAPVDQSVYMTDITIAIPSYTPTPLPDQVIANQLISEGMIEAGMDIPNLGGNKEATTSQSDDQEATDHTREAFIPSVTPSSPLPPKATVPPTPTSVAKPEPQPTLPVAPHNPSPSLTAPTAAQAHPMNEQQHEEPEASNTQAAPSAEDLSKILDLLQRMQKIPSSQETEQHPQPQHQVESNLAGGAASWSDIKKSPKKNSGRTLTSKAAMKNHNNIAPRGDLSYYQPRSAPPPPQYQPAYNQRAAPYVAPYSASDPYGFNPYHDRYNNPYPPMPAYNYPNMDPADGGWRQPPRW